MAVVLTLLVVGLGGLLVLNTVLAEGAFRVHDLEAKVAVLADQEQALQQQVAGLAAPARLMQRARALGMVPMSGPAFLRTSDGKILGRPAPAAPAPWLSPPSPVAPTPAPTATATTDPKPEAKADQNKAADKKKADKSSDQPADATSTGAGR
ncbi:MAG: cell division protein FtsL [Actinomycetota bacterium]|nr:cell division protein FtsL [Actinomycetota bacterium]MDH5277568.1 cell division protein FtsL [Actinomycetota bacterium]